MHFIYPKVTEKKDLTHYVCSDSCLYYYFFLIAWNKSIPVKLNLQVSGFCVEFMRGNFKMLAVVLPPDPRDFLDAHVPASFHLPMMLTLRCGRRREDVTASQRGRRKEAPRHVGVLTSVRHQVLPQYCAPAVHPHVGLTNFSEFTVKRHWRLFALTLLGRPCGH